MFVHFSLFPFFVKDFSTKVEGFYLVYELTKTYSIVGLRIVPLLFIFPCMCLVFCLHFSSKISAQPKKDRKFIFGI